MSKFIWTGPRESDIEYTGKFFDGAVTLYGDGKKNMAFCATKDYRINHNDITEEQTNFMVESEMKFIQEDSSVKFMSYNPNLIFGCKKEVVQHTICMNEEKLMRFLDSKIKFREFAEPLIHTLHSELIRGAECDFLSLKKRFPDSDNWIIQSDIASGGYQTFLLNSVSEKRVCIELQDEKEYLVSTYYEKNIPINIHVIIYDNDILLTPGSIQVMGVDRDRILYRGADFIAYQDIEEKIREHFIKDVRILSKEIQKMGYRGIIGIDAIVVDGEAKILEVNNRFQASSILVNKALMERGLPSLQELNYEAFHQKKSCFVEENELFSLDVHYSMYTFIDEKQGYHAENIIKTYKNEEAVVAFLEDGYDISQKAQEEAYLFRLIFNTNIVSIAEGKCVRIHPNIEAPSIEWYQDIIECRDFRKIKISLLNQGVVLEESVKKYIEEKGGMRPGVYFSVDLTLEEKYIVNSPLSVKFVGLSPYRVDLEKGKFYLFYYGEKICEVKIDYTDKNAIRETSKGIPVNKICLLATDRLRIQNSDFCTFKENNIPCRFCEVQYKEKSFTVEDILEAVSFYIEESEPNFRHILIGGLSNHIGKEKNNICDIIKYIRMHSDMSIYLMCLPCVHLEDIEEYVKLGVTEIGFNIEVFDRKLAAHYMPGKGSIPLRRYQKALEKAVLLLGNKGAVRSAFVVGLESMESLLEGVEFVCQLGVAPIFSVFRPIPFTEMESVIPPSNQWLLEAYEKAEKICKQYGLQLGPECAACQNNTLSFDVL